MPTRSASGRHTASRLGRTRTAGTSRRRLRFLPSPAIIGVLALLVAGGGVFAGPKGLLPGDDDASQVTQAASDYHSGDATQGTERSRLAAEPQVSRSGVDRQALKRQAQQQAQQRSTALAALADETEQHATKLKKAKKKRIARREAREARQWVLPVAGYQLTARFGQSSGLWSSVHTGLDFAAPSGTQIVSVAQGTVTDTSADGAYGNKTVIELEDGTEVWYCHQTSQEVSTGDEVDPGDPIGTVGSTGNVTGPHLHLEIRPGGGEPVDPEDILAEHNVTP